MTRALLLLIAAGACASDVPARPSYQQDVQPILAANCVRCHGYPAIGGAPRLMRLDSYADLVVDERDESGQLQEDVALGAAGLHELIVAGVNGGDASLGVGAMPPRFSLDDNQIETLERWSATADASGRPARGEPRDGNRVPVIAILETSQAGALVVLRTDVSDADGDLVAGELRVRVGAVDRFVGGLRSGLFEVRWDTAEIQPTIPPGTYPLFARLDDGADVSEISLGMLSIGGP